MNEEKNFKLLIAEQYEKDELPVLGRKDTFEFACVRCGECCRNREDILLNPFDIFRLCKAKEMSVVDFFKKYCELYPGESSKLPLAIIKFRPVYEFGSDRVIGTRCPFLGQKDGLHFCRDRSAGIRRTRGDDGSRSFGYGGIRPRRVQDNGGADAGGSGDYAAAFGGKRALGGQGCHADAGLRP